MSPFRAQVAEINKRCLTELITAGVAHYRCIALHTCTGRQALSFDDLEDYFKYADDKEYGARCVDFAVGSRVRVTHNLATKLGTTLLVYIHYIVIFNSING